MKQVSFPINTYFPGGSVCSDIITITTTDEGDVPEDIGQAYVSVDSCLFGPEPEDPKEKRSCLSSFRQDIPLSEKVEYYELYKEIRFDLA